MSVWSEISGTVVMKNGCGLSVCKAVKEIYCETVCTAETNYHKDCYEVSFNFAICLDGMAAAKAIQKFVEIVTTHKGYVRSQIVSEIRWS